MDPLAPASPWLIGHRDLVEQAARRGPVVELACGRGRIALTVAGWGVPVVGLDRNAGFLGELRTRADAANARVAAVRADLEKSGLPLRPGGCGAILVFRYLHRPLAHAIAGALAPGGLLLYETFTVHQRSLGQGPRNPAFLLSDGELPALFAALTTISHWEGVSAEATPQALARLAARRPGG